jgi:hypothetical protein
MRSERRLFGEWPSQGSRCFSHLGSSAGRPGGVATSTELNLLCFCFYVEKKTDNNDHADRVCRPRYAHRVGIGRMALDSPARSSREGSGQFFTELERWNVSGKLAFPDSSSAWLTFVWFPTQFISVQWRPSFPRNRLKCSGSKRSSSNVNKPKWLRRCCLRLNLPEKNPSRHLDRCSAYAREAMPSTTGLAMWIF